MRPYVDTGILVKLYAAESNSSVADALVITFDTPLPITHLQELELRTALRLKQGRGELTEEASAGAICDFEGDLATGRLVRPTYDLHAVFAQAESLSRRFSAATKCRTLDVLHVAAALELGCKEFASFDQRQRLVADASGMRILPFEVS